MIAKCHVRTLRALPVGGPAKAALDRKSTISLRIPKPRWSADASMSGWRASGVTARQALTVKRGWHLGEARPSPPRSVTGAEISRLRKSAAVRQSPGTCTA